MSKRKIPKQTSIDSYLHKRLKSSEEQNETETRNNMNRESENNEHNSEFSSDHTVSSSEDSDNAMESDFENSRHSLRHLGEEDFSFHFQSENEILCLNIDQSNRTSNDYVPLPHFSDIYRWKNTKKHLKKINSMESFCEFVKKNNRDASKDGFGVLEQYLKQNKSDINLLNEIGKFATHLDELCKKKIPYLKGNQNKCITLSQYQIACLLANAFCCTLHNRKDRSEYHPIPPINFNRLLSSNEDVERKHEKLQCIFNYFKKIIPRWTSKEEGTVVTFDRRYYFDEDLPKWLSNNEKIGSEKFVIVKDEITSEFSEIDFANKFIGGGVIGKGCVQEEIMFVQNPELIVSRLFTEKLEDTECLVITGYETFNETSGYSNTFRCNKVKDDRTGFYRIKGTPLLQRLRQTIAIDALHFHATWKQYDQKNLNRELNKAYVGFNEKQNTTEKSCSAAVATGNWGCGAFNGDKELKFLIQLMAATVAKRQVLYSTFNDEGQAKKFSEMYSLLKKKSVTVQKIYDILLQYGSKHENSYGVSVFQFIKEFIFRLEEK